MVFFSHMQGRPVIDVSGKLLGSLKDLVFVDGDKYAEISHLIYLDDRKLRKKTPWNCVKELKDVTDDQKIDIDIYLNLPGDKLNLEVENGKEFLVSHLFDRQLIDVDGVRIIRVNDVLLGKVENKFCIVAVDVGTKSLLRRMGIEGFFGVFMRKMQDHIVPWEYVESLSEEMSELRVKVQRSKISDMHPADIADIMEDLSYKERVLIFNALDNKTAAETLVEAHPAIQQSVFKTLKSKRIVEIIEHMPNDDAADLLGMMPPSKSEELLKLIRPDVAEKIKKLMQYSSGVAGGLMSTEFITIHNSFTAENAINKLRQLAPSSQRIYYVYVCDEEGKLAGVLSLRDLVISPPERKVAEFMSTDVASVNVETPKEEVYKIMNRYNIMVLPVLDSKNKIVGIISADDVIDLMIPETLKRQRPLIKRKFRKARKKTEIKKTSDNTAIKNTNNKAY